MMLLSIGLIILYLLYSQCMLLQYTACIDLQLSSKIMTFYDFTSTLLTIIGYSVLVYRIIFELESGKLKKSRQQKLCTKWLIFTIFLKVEYYILAVIEIIPFGTLFMLVVKLLLFLPENAFSHMIYKKIQKHLEKVKLEEYNSHFGIALSFVCTHTVALLMKLTKKIAAYIDSKHIEEVEKHILDIIKTLQYKKAAINMRHQAVASEINRELNTSEFNISMEEPHEIPLRDQTPSKNFVKTAIGDRMSKILTEIESDHEGNDQRIKMKAEVMIVKPDKAKGQKAKYEEVEIEFYFKTAKVSLVNKNDAAEMGTLKEVRWITKNMMNVELVLSEEEGRSKIIKLKENQDVVKWVEPVCMAIEKAKELISEIKSER